MDAAVLDRRTRMHDECIPPDLVDRLLALGHADVVRAQALAEDGDWFCARAWARLLAGRGELEEALRVLAPYVGTGWWTATAEAARLLDSGGRGEEAIFLVRPFARDGERFALHDLALLLARHGRGEEAYVLLLPHVADWSLAEALVEVGVGLGRGEEVAALLTARIAPGCPCTRCGSPECGGRYPEPFNAVNLLASVREGQGRTNEAVEVLRTYGSTPVNSRDPLAELLVRHGRIDELRAYAADEDRPEAVRHLAELLEARGDVAGAVEVYRRHAEHDGWHAPTLLAQLLARHGRGAEAIEVMRALDSAEDWVADLLCGLFAAEGRAEEGLAHLDALKARRGKEEWELFRLRGPLLAACGQLDEAVEEARVHPEGGSPYAVESLAGLLADAGRPEEAVALLDADRLDHRRTLGPLLVELGRVEEAMALLRTPRPVVPLPEPTGYSDCPPF
ncbi:tetratricopeptide repeat protein [Streptomyces sp. NPDC057486]|uniref:tetratricopeptide repeat protein n=1 Tax=Streptomyces sp. NPDC057486 TaxID=3346145 RepID=UPI0036740256